jgi:hypothetical protein
MRRGENIVHENAFSFVFRNIKNVNAVTRGINKLVCMQYEVVL